MTGYLQHIYTLLYFSVVLRREPFLPRTYRNYYDAMMAEASGI